MIYLSALLIGVVAGLRAMTAPAVTSWAARLGWLRLEGTPLAWMGMAVTPWIWSVLAIAELVNDQLPKTPSRKTPPAFIARIVMGALSGACVGASAGMLAAGGVGGAGGGGVGRPGGGC